MSAAIIGCGDVGRRIAKQLLEAHIDKKILAVVQSKESAQLCNKLGFNSLTIDLDTLRKPSVSLDVDELYYLVPPQKNGIEDKRTQAFLQNALLKSVKKIVLISTTGVYGDHQGEWVTEQTMPNPQTPRGKRRLNMEKQWLAWATRNDVLIVVLRVPGIYAKSRLPLKRLKKGTPVVNVQECGFTNRIHIDDLVMVAVMAMAKISTNQIYNVTDGTPGTITEYLQAAAKTLGLPSLPEITMQQAKKELSADMLSYLSESRKISNQKMLVELSIELQYPDFTDGLMH